MENELKNIRLKFNCPADWEAMDSVDGSRFCTHCKKNVYDFTDAKRDEFLKILAENGGNVCGRYRLEQTIPQINMQFSAWKKWLSAAMVLIGVNIFNNKVEAQNRQHLKLKSQQIVSAGNTDIITGMIDEIPPIFPGKNGGFNNFLKNNLHYVKGMKNGKIIASFTIEKDGSLNNIKIVRSLSLLNDNEVIRVLKLSPKWIPSKQGNKSIATEFSIPINFSDELKK